jgi:hypothetical protein
MNNLNFLFIVLPPFLGEQSSFMQSGPCAVDPDVATILETEVEDDLASGLDFAKPQKTSTGTAPRLPSNINADLFFGDGELGKIVFDDFEALRR